MYINFLIFFFLRLKIGSMLLLHCMPILILTCTARGIACLLHKGNLTLFDVTDTVMSFDRVAYRVVLSYGSQVCISLTNPTEICV